MLNMENCIFCKIVKGEIPCDKAYEDEYFFAFLTIEPVSDGHLLIIPKEHVVWMQDASDETLAGIFKVAKKLMKAIKKAFKADYVQESVAGEEVQHFHVHLFPRYLNDGLLKFPTKKYKDGESGDVVKKIIQAL